MFGEKFVTAERSSDRARTCDDRVSRTRNLKASPLCSAIPTIGPCVSCDVDGNDEEYDL
jgi:hypothetical protein